MIKSNLLSKITNSKLSDRYLVLDHHRIGKYNPLPTTPLFGNDGIGGRVGAKELFNSSFVFRIGLCTGRIWRKSNHKLAPIILGQDASNSSDMLAVTLTEGLIAAGIEVWNLGVCSSPAVAHLTKVSDVMGGIMISTSDNSPEDNEIKFFDANGAKLSTLAEREIEAELRSRWGKPEIKLKNSFGWGKQIHRGELLAQYVDSLQQPFEKETNLAGLKIVLDLAWGASVNIAPEVFKAQGAEVITLHDQLDSDRYFVNCDSTHLEDLQQVVKQHQADLGFAFNRDANRVVAVDAQGQVVDGDYILYFLGQALRQQNRLPNNMIVTTEMANLGFEKAWKNSGGKLVRTEAGERNIYNKMAEIGAILGGAKSGEIFCHHYGVSSDGILTALHLAAVVKQSGKSLQKMLNQSFTAYPQILQNVVVEDAERRLNWQDDKPFQKAIAEAEAAMGSQGRVLVRASETEPVIQIMVEAINADLARNWTNHLVLCAKKLNQ